jgi:hypothetical protein
MNLSKRTLILLLVGILGILAAVFSARKDEEPDELETDETEVDETEVEKTEPESIAKESPGPEEEPNITTFKGSE